MIKYVNVHVGPALLSSTKMVPTHPGQGGNRLGRQIQDDEYYVTTAEDYKPSKRHISESRAPAQGGPLVCEASRGLRQNFSKVSSSVILYGKTVAS